jgi:hypothetical protein
MKFIQQKIAIIKTGVAKALRQYYELQSNGTRSNNTNEINLLNVPLR